MEPPATTGKQETAGRAEMSYQVMHRAQPIGSSRLEGSDRSMAMAFGAFEPLPAYEAVRAIFRLFTEALPDGRRGANGADEEKLATYERARDALHLTLQTADGRLIPTTWIHIVDWDDLGREVEAHIPDTAFWQERGQGLDLE